MSCQKDGDMKEKITSKTCLSCGACCVAPNDQEVFCDLVESDIKRLGEKWVQKHALAPNPITLFSCVIDGAPPPPLAIRSKYRAQRAGRLKGWELCCCVALRGSVMNQVSCSVYEKRPRACRMAVKPGDSACRRIRQAFDDYEPSEGDGS